MLPQMALLHSFLWLFKNANGIISFLFMPLYVLHSSCTNIHPPRREESPLLCTLSPAFIISSYLGDGHLGQCEVTPNGSFICISLIISDV